MSTGRIKTVLSIAVVLTAGRPALAARGAETDSDERAGTFRLTAQPGDLIVRHGEGILGPPLTIGLADDIPHVGVIVDRHKYGFSAVELQMRKVDGANYGVMRTARYNDDTRFKNRAYFSVLESNIPVKYRDQMTTFKDLPHELKMQIRNEVQEMLAKEAAAEKVIGPYKAFGFGKSSQCFDHPLEVYNEALRKSAVDVYRYEGAAAFAGKWGPDKPLNLNDRSLVPGALRDWFAVGEGSQTWTDPSKINDKLPRVGSPNFGWMSPISTSPTYSTLRDRPLTEASAMAARGDEGLRGPTIHTDSYLSNYLANENAGLSLRLVSGQEQMSFYRDNIRRVENEISAAKLYVQTETRVLSDVWIPGATKAALGANRICLAHDLLSVPQSAWSWRRGVLEVIHKPSWNSIGRLGGNVAFDRSVDVSLGWVVRRAAHSMVEQSFWQPINQRIAGINATIDSYIPTKQSELGTFSTNYNYFRNQYIGNCLDAVEVIRAGGDVTGGLRSSLVNTGTVLSDELLRARTVAAPPPTHVSFTNPFTNQRTDALLSRQTFDALNQGGQRQLDAQRQFGQWLNNAAYQQPHTYPSLNGIQNRMNDWQFRQQFRQQLWQPKIPSYQNLMHSSSFYDPFGKPRLK